MRRIRFAKLLCLTLTVVLLGTLTACGAGKGKPEATGEPTDNANLPDASSVESANPTQTMPFVQIETDPTVDKSIGLDTESNTYPEVGEVTQPPIAELPVEGDKEA